MNKLFFSDQTDTRAVPEEIRISSWFLALYVVLLPVSTGLTGLFGSSISPMNYIAILYFLASFVEIIRRPCLLLKNEFCLVYLFFFYTAASFLWNGNKEFDWYLTTFLTTVFFFTIAASRRYSEKELKLFIYASFVSIAIIFAVVAINFPTKNLRMIVKVIQTMDPNDFGCGLCVVIALVMTLCLQRKNYWMILILSFLFMTIVLSSSRGAMLLSFCMMLWWIGAAAVKRKVFITLIPIIMFLYLFLLVILMAPKILNINGNTISFIIGRMNPASLINDGGAGRSEIWKSAVKTFLSSGPLRMLFGHGHGSFRYVVLYPGPTAAQAYYSHNMYINALLEGGVVGLILILLAFVQLFLYTLRNKNLWGTLALIGFSLEGISIDAQAFRVFAWAFIVAAIYKGGDDFEILFAAPGDGDRTDLQG